MKDIFEIWISLKISEQWYVQFVLKFDQKSNYNGTISDYDTKIKKILDVSTIAVRLKI